MMGDGIAMEHLPEYLLDIWKSDLAENCNLLFKISDEIEEYTNDTFILCDKYAEIVYKLKWPDDKEKSAFENANRNAEKMIPTLLRGVVIDNYLVGDSDMRCLELVDINRFHGKELTDAETLLHLQETIDVQYALFACRYRKNFAYSIGALEDVRPGTKVILSLIDLEFAPNNPERWITAYFTDIIADDGADLIYLDSEYRIHHGKEYLMLYKSIRDRETVHSKASNDREPAHSKASSGGCYIATAVYGSYDCPEVWTLRRYRDNVLAKTKAGRLFVKTYYKISPIFVKWFGNTGWFQHFLRTKLDRMVLRLQSKGIKSDRYDDVH